MTFQPPPPGGNPPAPPPPPPGQWGPPPGGPAGSGGSFDPKSVNPLDWALLGIGLLIFIFSFIDFYTYSAKGGFGGGSLDQSAWSGFFGWFAVLLVIAATVLIALDLFMPQFKLPMPNRLIGLGCYAVALLCLILAIFVVPDYGGGGPGYDAAVDEGHGFGYWACLILTLGGLVVALMRVQQTGTALPGPLANMPNIGNRGPQGGIGGSHGGGHGGGRPGPGPGPGPGPNQPPPPPPGYGPPQ